MPPEHGRPPAPATRPGHGAPLAGTRKKKEKGPPRRTAGGGPENPDSSPGREAQEAETMSPVIENFVTAVNQAIMETIADYDRREAARRNKAVNAPQVTDGLAIIRDPEEIFEPEAEARRAATINAACDALLRQATINVECTDRYGNGVTARHEVTIATQDGGSACAMIHWGEDHMDFWTEGRPQQD